MSSGSNSNFGRSRGGRWNYNKWRGRGSRWPQKRSNGFSASKISGRGGRLMPTPIPASGTSSQGITNSGISSYRKNDSSQKSIRVMLPSIHCPYKGWHLYMNEGYFANSETVQFIKYFEDYYRRNPDILKGIENKYSFILNTKILFDDKDLTEKLPNIAELTISSPQKIINCLGLAAHQVLSNNLEKTLQEEAAAMFRDQSFNEDTLVVEESIANASIPIIHARLSHLETIPLKSLKASYYGKLVAVKGTVVRISCIKPICKQMAFSCLNCNSVQAIIQPEGKYTMPTSCQDDNCQSRSFVPKISHKLTKTVNWQNIQLQEVMNDDQGEQEYKIRLTAWALINKEKSGTVCQALKYKPLQYVNLRQYVTCTVIHITKIRKSPTSTIYVAKDGGRIPRTIDCEVMEDLVDQCIPGDLITLIGIVKVHENEDVKGSRGQRATFDLYIDANSVINSKDGNDSSSAVGIEFSMKDYYAIEKIQSEPQLFKLLVASLCPIIYGHVMVKAGLLLCLFGGCSKSLEGCVPVRGEPHMLVVGDPGLGKSQMLQACSNVAPRGVYVCGNTTTTAGLTVTLSKDGGKGGGDYSLEGGALVLADQGICCIDEFDKMGNQHQALLEAMEQQSISIAKAGIVCSLPARTSILAAANPVGGHYNKAKTVSENIKMSGPLLSRFDLVFILLDKPDEELDNLLSEHVMAVHSARPKNKTGLNVPPRVRKQELMDTSLTEEEREKPFRERLKYSSSEIVDPIPHQLIRKYICYARKYVHPKLTETAAKVIQDFYLELRRKLQNSDSTPITTRQLESLVRLSEARARCELREEVTETDAREVVEIMKFSMIDTYSDEFGLLDFQRSQHGSGASNRSQMKKFVSGLQRVSESTYNSLFTVDSMKQLSAQLNLKITNFSDFVESLNHQGYLIKKGPKVYQLLTAD